MPGVMRTTLPLPVSASAATAGCGAKVLPRGEPKSDVQ